LRGRDLPNLPIELSWIIANTGPNPQRHGNEESAMCDYSLEHVASRPAKVGDRLTTTRFKFAGAIYSPTVGFCAVGRPDMAVGVLPGTELAFDREIEVPAAFWMRHRLGDKVGRFRRVNEDKRHWHHDALELPDGRIVMLTALCEGQHATVLQLPVGAQEPRPAKEPRKATAA
jgi:hypothetical protein